MFKMFMNTEARLILLTIFIDSIMIFVMIYDMWEQIEKK